MTVSTTTSRVEYAGNGSTTAFSVPFYFLASGDLKVYKAGVLQTLTTHYTVSGAGSPAGGTVTFLSAPTTGQAVVVFRDPALTQNTDYVPNDPFPAESHERALDRLTMIAQRNRDLIGRAFVLSDGDTSGASTTLPSPEANKVIAWDSAGTALQNRDATDFATALTYADRRVETFTGNGTTVDFVLAETPAVIANTDIDIEGVSQVPGVDYQLLADGVTIRFDIAPPNGQTICVKYGQAVAQSRDDAETVYYSPAGAGAVSRSVQSKLRDTVSVKDFGALGNGVADDAAAIQAVITAHPGKTIYFPAGTYYLATALAGAYLTLAGAGTTLLFDRNAKLLFLDAAVYGINITAQMCTVRGGMLWGTNTTSPTITVACRIAAPYCVVEGNNIAYASIGTQVSATYVVKHLNNTYSNCDRYFRTSGSCADVQSRGNTYGTTTIGTNAVVELNGSGGADLHDYWETQQRTKLSLACNTGSQRVQVRGKIFDSGGVTVGTSVFCRLDIENQQSYTGTAFLNVAAGGQCDATGSWLNGPGITSGVAAVVGDGNFNMSAGYILGWQVGIDANGGVYVAPGVLISQCTTGVDIATAASGIVNPAYAANTTNIVRTTASTVSMPNAWSGSATYDPPNLADGAGASTTITVTGARAGDTAAASFSNDLQGILLTAWCATDTVNVRFQNETGGALDLASGTLRATVSSKTI